MSKHIKDFFDQISVTRDEQFSQDPILGYEQEMRQNAISSLLDDGYDRALEAGCGNGRDFQILSKHTQKLFSIDFSPGMLRGAKLKIKTIGNTSVYLATADITNLPFKDASFDLIVCSEVLEHIPRWLKAIFEFRRVLKPKGDLIISTPNKYSMYGLTRYPGRLLLGSKHAYDKWKSYPELKSALQDAGFEVTAVIGACYLPGDISYYTPFRQLVTFLLNIYYWLDRKLSHFYPFSVLGYMVVLRSKKAPQIGEC